MANSIVLDSLWIKRPLQFQPFLPEDNCPDITSPQYAWLQHASKELSWLLHLKFPKFASYVIYDPQLRLFLDSFLRYRSRPYDSQVHIIKNHDKESIIKETTLPTTNNLIELLDKRIFFIYLRIATYKEIDSLISSKNFKLNNDKLVETCQFGELISGEGGVLSFPKIMDVAALYGLSNNRLTSKLLGEVLSMSSSIPPSITKAGATLLEVLSQFNPHKIKIEKSQNNHIDSLSYILDCTASWHSLINARPSEIFTALVDIVKPAISLKSKNEKKYCNRSDEKKEGFGNNVTMLPCEFIHQLSVCYERSIPYLYDQATSQSEDLKNKIEIDYLYQQSGYYLLNIFHDFLIWSSKLILYKFEEEDMEREAENIAETLYSLLISLCQDDEVSNDFETKCSLFHTREKGTFIGDYDQCFGLSLSVTSTSSSTSSMIALAFEKIGFDEQRLKFLSDVVNGCKSSPTVTHVSKEEDDEDFNGRDGGVGGGGGGGRFIGKEPTEKEMEELVTEVQMVMPELGVGFIEACIASYKFNVGEVINSVMDENLPPHLAVMDRSTPKYRVHRGKQDDKMDKAIEAGMEGDREFATVKRDYIKKFETLQEKKHKQLVSEYDDDYDDQFDEPVHFNVGEAEDFEEIKQMNKFTREQEEEDHFWDSMKNTNRKEPKLSAHDSDDESGLVDGTDGTNIAAKPFVPASSGSGGGGGGGKGHQTQETHKQSSKSKGGKKGKQTNTDDSGDTSVSGGKEEKNKEAKGGGKGTGEKGGGKGGGKGEKSSELTDAQKRRKNQNKNKGHRVGADKKMARNSPF